MIKPCPCGQTPEFFEIQDIWQGTKWALAVPNCCGEWPIKFRTQYLDLKSSECMDLAIKAWNNAPRSSDKPQDNKGE